MIYSFPRTLLSNKHLTVKSWYVFKKDLGDNDPIRSVGNFQCRTVVIETLSTNPPQVLPNYTVYPLNTHTRLVGDVGYKVIVLHTRDTVKPKTFCCIYAGTLRLSLYHA